MKEYITNPPSNLCSIGINNTQDGHGGRAKEHHEEMKQIAVMMIQEIVPEMIAEQCERIWSAAIGSLHDVLSREIHSIVSIGIKGCADIFYGEKAQKYITDSIVSAMEHAIRGIKLKK